jgi:mannose-6-phosphate isomerase-like protein (cupin superfamily)
MTKPLLSFETGALKPERDYTAPDGSEIRLLLEMTGGGISHCTLPVGQTSSAKRHQGVEEIWYILEGQGEVWRRDANQEVIVQVHPGICLTIPTGTSFQFRNVGMDPLRILITTMPPWPGAEEAVATPGHWPEVGRSSGH